MLPVLNHLKLCDGLNVLTIHFVSIAQDFTVAFVAEHLQSLFNGVISAVQEALIIGYTEIIVICCHCEPLYAVAYILAAAFGEEIVAGVAGDADDVGMNACFIFHAPECYIVGMIVVADNALGHHPFTAIAHQQKNLFIPENNAACAAANCTCHTKYHPFCI